MNFRQGGGSRSVWQKKLWRRFFGFFFFPFSPQLVVQKSNGQFLRNLSFFKVPEGVQHFPGGPTFSRGSNCLFTIETHITCDFPGGSGPPVPHLDPHLSNNYLGRTIISLCTGNWWKKYFNTLFIKKKKSTAGETRTRSLQFVPLRYNHLPTLQYNTRLIAYTVFVLRSSTCTIGNTRKIAKYNELFRRKLFRPWNLFISTGLIFTSYALKDICTNIHNRPLDRHERIGSPELSHWVLVW